VRDEDDLGLIVGAKRRKLTALNDWKSRQYIHKLALQCPSLPRNGYLRSSGMSSGESESDRFNYPYEEHIYQNVLSNPNREINIVSLRLCLAYMSASMRASKSKSSSGTELPKQKDLLKDPGNTLTILEMKDARCVLLKCRILRGVCVYPHVL